MSSYVKATNFTAKDSLPSGNAGKIIKGTEIDTEFTAIAAAVSSKADSNSPTFTGTPAAPTASTGTNTTQVATTAFVNASILYAVPSGVITLWSGAISAIPSGWSLCNGSSGTPDLRDRFVVGAGTTYAVGATGGANTVTLDATMIPAHTHSFSATTGSTETAHTHTYSGTSSGQSATHTHTATVTDPTHRHSFSGAFGNGTSASNPNGYSDGSAYTQYTAYAATGITVSNGSASADHTHTYSGTTSAASSTAHTHSVSGTTGSIGGGLAHENRPPYYALAWIMKL